jgi:hypothetical protein
MTAGTMRLAAALAAVAASLSVSSATIRAQHALGTVLE